MELHKISELNYHETPIHIKKHTCNGIHESPKSSNCRRQLYTDKLKMKVRRRGERTIRADDVIILSSSLIVIVLSP